MLLLLSSLPFSLPLISGRVFEDVPERGDVVVFKLPTDNKTDFIKRIIGLPGDEIQVKGGILHINGKPVTRERVEDFVSTDDFGTTRRVLICIRVLGMKCGIRPELSERRTLGIFRRLLRSEGTGAATGGSPFVSSPASTSSISQPCARA